MPHITPPDALPGIDDTDFFGLHAALVAEHGYAGATALGASALISHR